MNKPGKETLLKILLIVVIFVFIFAGWKIYENYRTVKNLEQEIEQHRQELIEVRQQREELKEELEKVEDDDFIERIAREKLGLVKPGETLLVPVEEEE